MAASRFQAGFLADREILAEDAAALFSLNEARRGVCPVNPTEAALPWGAAADGAGLPGNPIDKAVCVQGEDHLMHGRRSHPEVTLHVELDRRLSMELRIEVNERKVLPLLVRVGFPALMHGLERNYTGDVMSKNCLGLIFSICSSPGGPFPVPNFMSILAGRASANRLLS